MKSVSEFFPDALGYPVQDIYRQEPADGLWQTIKGPDGKSVRVQVESLASVLNPPPEPDLTFDQWYAELEQMMTQPVSYVNLEVRPLLLAHARKRIRP